MGMKVNRKEKASANELWMLNDSDIFIVLDFIDADIRRTKKSCGSMDRSRSLFMMII